MRTTIPFIFNHLNVSRVSYLQSIYEYTQFNDSLPVIKERRPQHTRYIRKPSKNTTQPSRYIRKPLKTNKNHLVMYIVINDDNCQIKAYTRDSNAGLLFYNVFVLINP